MPASVRTKQSQLSRPRMFTLSKTYRSLRGVLAPGPGRNARTAHSRGAVYANVISAKGFVVHADIEDGQPTWYFSFMGRTENLELFTLAEHEQPHGISLCWGVQGSEDKD